MPGRRHEREDERHTDGRGEARVPALPPAVSAVLEAQRTIGNQAVGRLLAREPGREPGPKKPPVGGRQVDEILDASPYFKDLVGEKMKLGVRAEKQLRYDDEATFEEAWVKYAVGKDVPGSKTNPPETYTPDTARAALNRGVRGFHDEDRGEIHIRIARADQGTPLHEGLHLFTHDGFKAFAGRELNEGVTEHFTRKLCQEVKVERNPSAYIQELYSVDLMLKELMVPEDCLATGYFKGDLDPLRRAMDGDKGMLERWTGLLNSGQFKAANDLVRRPKGDFQTTERIRATA